MAMSGLQEELQPGEGEGPSVHLCLDNLKGLTSVLAALKSSTKQVALSFTIPESLCQPTVGHGLGIACGHATGGFNHTPQPLPWALPMQVCSVVVAPEGLSLRWEDESKTLQSSIFLRCEVC